MGRQPTTEYAGTNDGGRRWIRRADQTHRARGDATERTRSPPTDALTLTCRPSPTTMESSISIPSRAPVGCLRGVQERGVSRPPGVSRESPRVRLERRAVSSSRDEFRDVLGAHGDLPGEAVAGGGIGSARMHRAVASSREISARRAWDIGPPLQCVRSLGLARSDEAPATGECPVGRIRRKNRHGLAEWAKR